MVIYLDLVIISTILVNTLIIMGIECIFNVQISILRIIISDILSILFLTLYLLPIGKLIFIRYLVGVFIGMISFKKCNIKNKIIKISLYYLFNISLVGVLEIFEIRNMTLLIISTIFIISLGIVVSFRNKDELIVKLNNKYMNALYDSGNYTLYKTFPVVYLNKKYLSDIYKLIDKISVSTINGNCRVDIYQGPILKINNQEFKVYYAFSESIEFDMILHKDLGGVRCLSY